MYKHLGIIVKCKIWWFDQILCTPNFPVSTLELSCCKMTHMTIQNGKQLFCFWTLLAHNLDCPPFTHTHMNAYIQIHTYTHKYTLPFTHTHTFTLLVFHSVRWILKLESPRTPLPRTHNSWSRPLAPTPPRSLRLWLSKTKLCLLPSRMGWTRSMRIALSEHRG